MKFPELINELSPFFSPENFLFTQSRPVELNVFPWRKLLQNEDPLSLYHDSRGMALCQNGMAHNDEFMFTDVSGIIKELIGISAAKELRSKYISSMEMLFDRCIGVEQYSDHNTVINIIICHGLYLPIFDTEMASSKWLLEYLAIARPMLQAYKFGYIPIAVDVDEHGQDRLVLWRPEFRYAK